MNFLNSGFLARASSRVPIWTTPGSRDVLKSSSVDSVGFRKKQVGCIITTAERPQSKLNRTYLSLMAGHVLWIQVRFNKGSSYPRLHRDLKMPNFDYYRKPEFRDVRKTTWGMPKSGVECTVAFVSYCIGMYSVKWTVIYHMAFMAAAADVRAMATIDVDIAKVPPGGCISVKWRGKPLFIKNRTPGEIDFEDGTPLSALKDPEKPEDRFIKPEWIIVIGICTHLGCVPVPNSGEYKGGFYCPCHGSHYDNIGRIRKGPAPTNLEVPKYSFVSDTVISVG